jgi:hypothetical protein
MIKPIYSALNCHLEDTSVRIVKERSEAHKKFLIYVKDIKDDLYLEWFDCDLKDKSIEEWISIAKSLI